LGEVAKEKWKPLQRFWRTRQAILKGQLLRHPDTYKTSGGEILSPWKFNGGQSLASVLTAKVALAILGVLITLPKAAPMDQDPRAAYLSATLSSIYEWLAVLAPPFAVAVIARVVAWATLKTGDLVATKKRAAAQRFLYLDGALGFWPQALLAFSYGLAIQLEPLTQTGAAYQTELSQPVLTGPLDLLALGTALLFAIGVVWQFALANFVIPRRLFLLNGYSNHPVVPWRARGPMGEPYLRYSVALLATSLLATVLVPVGAGLLASLGAFVAVSLKFGFSGGRG
jgi:hypothetical protein